MVGPNKRQWRFLSDKVTESDVNRALKDLNYAAPEDNVVDRAAQEEYLDRKPASYKR